MSKKRMSNQILLIVTLLVGTFFAATAFGQGYGKISGVVADSTGAVIPGATITATQNGTDAKSSVTTNDQGEYVFPSLAPSRYDLSVAASGFTGYLQRGILLQADAAVTVNAALKTGSSSETITVTSDALQVDTTTSTIAQVVDTARINELPLNGRNAAALTTLVTGVVIAPNQGADQGSQKSFPGVVTISANGTRANQTNYMLDGGNNVDEYTNVNAPFPMPDSVQEFSVQTSNYNAEYGQNAGGVVNVITKSGTNKFHGDLFEYVRNADLNAANYFGYAQPTPTSPLQKLRDPQKRNQFGGTIGGPVLHDKLFFFFGYQKTILHTASTAATASILPTAAQLAGQFTNNVFDPATCPTTATSASAAAGCTQFAGNFISPSRFSPVSLALLKYLPTPNSAGSVLYKKPVQQNFSEYTGRVDYTVGPNDRLTVRYFLDRFAQNPVLDLTNLLTYADGSTIQYHNSLISETHTFTQSLVNTFVLTYQIDDSVRGPAAGSINATDLGVNIWQPGFKSIQSISINGGAPNGFSVGDSPAAYFSRANYTLGDDVHWTKGTNSMSFGFHGEISKSDINNQSNQPGAFTFASSMTGDANATFLLGYLSSFTQGSGQYLNNRNKFTGFYAQDSWKATHRLTVNYGVRYEPFRPWTEKFHRIGVFSPAALTAGRVSTLYPNAPPGLLFSGDAGVAPNGINPSYTDVMPRVGFANDVFGDGKTSVRGGFGLFYDTRLNAVWNNGFSNLQPFVTSVSQTYQPGYYTGLQGDFANPYGGSNHPFANPFPAPQPPPSTSAFGPNSWITFDPTGNFPVPLTYVWNLSVEQQLAPGLASRLAYVGSHGSHNFTSIDINPTFNSVNDPGANGLASNVGKRVYGVQNSAYLTNQITQTEMGGSTHYNSLQASLEQRMRHGVSMVLNYTWSHATDDLPYNTGVTSAGAGNSYVVPVYEANYKRLDHGASDFDHRNVIVLSYVWDIPKLHEGPAFARAIINGWQTTGLVQARSGDALTITSGTNNSGTSLGRDRAVYSGAAAYGATACSGVATACRGWLLPTAFATNPTYASNPALAYGNVVKGAFVGPRYTDWDTSLHRVFKITERTNLQFRAEYFNVVNHTNFGDPGTSLSSSSFGRITGTTSNNGFVNDPRIAQLALKLNF